MAWAVDKINFIDVIAKCRHLKKLAWEKDFAAGVYQRQEIANLLRTFSHVDIFSPAL
jgi:hypothetical protein